MIKKEKSRQLECQTSINYATIPGSNLPFTVTLDLAASNLDPDAGENQRFCYRVAGVGTDSPLFNDLSHIVFSICPDITEEQIENITVFIGDDEQEVEFGDDGNVQLVDPDPQTGCPGLKFDFEVSKIAGDPALFACFELNTRYSVGDVPVCLFGGGQPLSGLSICGPVCREPAPCRRVVYQRASVCVPVTVTPFADNGDTQVFCCGPATIITGATTCPGFTETSCSFTITQDLCIVVPLTFGADPVVSPATVQCLGVSTSPETCENCLPDED